MKMSKRRGAFQDFRKVGDGVYQTLSGKTRIERGDNLGESKRTWWVSDEGGFINVFNSLMEALGMKWD